MVFHPKILQAQPLNLWLVDVDKQQIKYQEIISINFFFIFFLSFLYLNYWLFIHLIHAL